MKKTIYHFGSLAGWPYTLAKGFRDRGFDSVNVISENSDTGGVTNSSQRSNRQLPFDRALSKKTDNKIKKLFDRIKFILEVIVNGKIVHYHGGTILPLNFDTYIFKFFNISMYMSWGGTDARLHEKTIQKNPYFYKFFDDVHDKKIVKKLKRLSNNNVIPISDPEMRFNTQEYFNKDYIFKAPIDLQKYKYIKRAIDIPIFLHIPTHPFAKGTIHITNAFIKLKKEGYKFDFKCLEPNLTQEEVREEISKCDVYVDELRVGCHGVTAIESMSLGKVTLTYLREDLVKEFPSEFPILNTNPDTIYDNLKELIIDPNKIYLIGERSRSYVEKYHDVTVVIEQLLKIYNENSDRDLEK